MLFNRSCFALLGTALLLSACMVQSSIQGRYVEKQSDCRSEAEDRMEQSRDTQTMSAKRRNAELVDRFSACMIKAGWHVARPVRNPPLVVGGGPAQPLPGQPSDVITAASPAKVSSPPNKPVKTETNLLQPGPGQPALSQPANSALPTGGAGAGTSTVQQPAAYQRTYAPDVGSTVTPMPGRKF